MIEAIHWLPVAIAAADSRCGFHGVTDFDCHGSRSCQSDAEQRMAARTTVYSGARRVGLGVRCESWAPRSKLDELTKIPKKHSNLSFRNPETSFDGRNTIGRQALSTRCPSAHAPARVPGRRLRKIPISVRCPDRVPARAMLAQYWKVGSLVID